MKPPNKKNPHKPYPGRPQALTVKQGQVKVAEVDAYRTFFLCELFQDSAFSTGGDEMPSVVDMGLARGGDGKVIYRGSALAGALLATARTFLTVPAEISRGIDSDEKIAQPGSLWQFDHARQLTDTEPPTEFRANTAHRHDTRAAHSGGFHDIEVLPRGFQWQFMLEVVHPPGDPKLGKQAAAQAALALREWQWGRCWLGRKVARGLGWMHLKACQVIELGRSPQAVNAWPDSGLDSLKARYHHLLKLPELVGATGWSLDDFIAHRNNDAGNLTARRAYARWSMQIEAGEYRAHSNDGTEKSYGLDAVSMLGHPSAFTNYPDITDHLICPASIRSALSNTFNPDTALAMTTPVGDSPEPLLAASGITGALRHHMARAQRAGGTPALDPVLNLVIPPPELRPDSISAVADPSSILFGALNKAGNKVETKHTPSRLLLSDGVLTDRHWKVGLLEKVGLDEFRQSAFPGAKYDRFAVLKGCWQLTAVQDIRFTDDQQDDLQKKAEILRAIQPFQSILAEAAKRRIGFGGGEFRGYGHLPMTVLKLESALAGQDWQTLQPDAPALEQVESEVGAS